MASMPRARPSRSATKAQASSAANIAVSSVNHLCATSKRAAKPSSQRLKCNSRAAAHLAILATMLRIVAAIFLVCALPAHGQLYDLVLRNAHVIDPKNNIDAQRDVAIR